MAKYTIVEKQGKNVLAPGEKEAKVLFFWVFWVFWKYGDDPTLKKCRSAIHAIAVC